MKQVFANIQFTVCERNRIIRAGSKMVSDVKVSFRALCKRLILQGVERIENAQD